MDRGIEPGIEPDLRKTENIFYPLALLIVVQSRSQATIASKALKAARPANAGVIKATLEPT